MTQQEWHYRFHIIRTIFLIFISSTAIIVTIQTLKAPNIRNIRIASINNLNRENQTFSNHITSKVVDIKTQEALYSTLLKWKSQGQLKTSWDIHTKIVQGISKTKYEAFTPPVLPSTIEPYNEAVAIYLAYVSSTSYCSKTHILKWDCSPCEVIPALDKISIVESPRDNFQGIVGYSDVLHGIIIAFRGSIDVLNWLDNLTFVKTHPYPEFPSVRVHEGFYWVYMSVIVEIRAKVQELRHLYPNAKIYITGHSLGGAVAGLCAFDLHYLNNTPVHSVITFGEPRIGNTEFSRRLNAVIPNIYRVIHNRDAVPHVPPKLMGFYHEVQEVFYDEYAASYRVCDATNGEDPMCADACAPFGCDSIVDHLTYLNVSMGHLLC